MSVLLYCAPSPLACYEGLVLDPEFLYHRRMANINGHRIIASHKTKQGDFVILAVGNLDAHEPYVTARVASLDDTEWYWGRYSRYLESAIVSFKMRSEIDLHQPI